FPDLLFHRSLSPGFGLDGRLSYSQLVAQALITSSTSRLIRRISIEFRKVPLAATIAARHGRHPGHCSGLAGLFVAPVRVDRHRERRFELVAPGPAQELDDRARERGLDL